MPSTSAEMLGFKKPPRRLNRGNQRRTKVDSDEERNGQEEQEEEGEDSIQETIARFKEKKGAKVKAGGIRADSGKNGASAKGATLLSFGDEGEGTE